jgi:hypothetical protein
MIARLFHRDLETTATARYSDCQEYRYELVIQWDAKLKPAMVIGLNPSTATERSNDPTITRLERWARRNGFGSLRMYNAYAYRSTDPKGLRTVADPVGPDNDGIIIDQFEAGLTPVLAWGGNISLARKVKILELWEAGRNWNPKWDKEPPHYPKCFAVTAEGHPWHPLYLSNSTLDAFKDYIP